MKVGDLVKPSEEGMWVGRWGWVGLITRINPGTEKRTNVYWFNEKKQYSHAPQHLEVISEAR